MKDTIYRSVNNSIKPFEFNDEVTNVFPDMILRSVPGYPLTISMISVIADKFYQTGSNIYDLGCSLGTVSIAISKVLKDKKCKIIAIDDSEAMIRSCCKNNIKENYENKIDFILDDMLTTNISNASIVVMNFSLQFIPLESRQKLVEKIFNGLLPGGALILSEKILFDDMDENDLMSRLHYHMKELNGYEKLEISSKRKSLEDVLIPEKIDTHLERLSRAGFKDSFVWLKCFNFASLVAFK
jgi:tRNA (cmo5U34)-methyltransferase|tara:strand:+ start:277 stop:999 length:723 start_codon:yes stop_codon:yes gene_type:complete